MPDTTEQWTLMRDGTVLIAFTSMLEANVQSDSAVLEEPLEQGSFAAFNRVQYSDVFRVKLAIEGIIAYRSVRTKNVAYPLYHLSSQIP